MYNRMVVVAHDGQVAMTMDTPELEDRDVFYREVDRKFGPDRFTKVVRNDRDRELTVVLDR